MARPGKRRLKPSGRNPYVVAARRLGHRVKPSAKRYRRKGRRTDVSTNGDT